MNLKTIATLVATLLFVVANAQKVNYLKVEELNKDFDFLVHTLKTTHPNPYAVISRTEFEKKEKNIREQLKDSLSLKQYYQLIAPLVSALQDGHTALTFPGRKLLSTKDYLFPYIVNASIEKPFLTVTETISADYEQIPVGAEILKINNHTAEDVIQRIIDNTSGESKAYRLKMGADYTMFAFLFGAFYELEETVAVTYRFENRDFEKTIPTVTFANLAEIAKKRKPSNTDKTVVTPDFSLLLKPEQKTAILDIRFFGDKDKFQEFLKTSFKTIRDKKIKKVIIDIRENGGGNSALGDELLKYIAAQPFRQFDRTLIKYSQLQKDTYEGYCKKEAQYCNQYNYMKEKHNGAVETFPAKDLTFPYAKSDRFNGKVFLLTGTRTFSSAMNFAQTFKQYKLGTIIGEETGGWLVSYGDKVTTTLPVSNIPLSVSTKKFYTVGATDKDFHGVKPDVAIKADKALEYIISQ